MLSTGWQECELGQPDWHWFIRGEENAYLYKLTNELFFTKSFREATAQMPLWFHERGARLLKIYFVDPAEIKKPKIIRAKLREGSGNFQSNMFKKIK